MKPSEHNSDWLIRKRLIDPKLKAAGWEIVPFSPHLSLNSHRNCAVTELETANGRMDALLKLAEAVEEGVTAATQNTDKLTQSILATAFRGELVPTEAELARRECREYESAAVLLERIKKERELNAAAPIKRSQKRPQEGSRFCGIDMNVVCWNPTPERSSDCGKSQSARNKRENSSARIHILLRRAS